MSESTKGNYEDFFAGLIEFKSLQDKQKQRGLNNYNLLTAVLKPSDEVRMHSRMMYSLLNLNGEHFQGALFLEKFLKVLEVKGFDLSDLNLDRCSVYKEYGNRKDGFIDLYITDGTKHIVIENKVHAGDQEKQIERYLELIKKENKEASATDVLVLYLTLDEKKPSQPSLGSLRIQGDNIFKDESKEAHYKSIQYKVEIMAWLDECQHEVQNITNLNQAIAAYKDVVKMINKEYKGKAMSLAEYIKDDEGIIYAMAVEVSEAVAEVRESIAEEHKSIVMSFFKRVFSQLEKELGDSWVVKISDAKPAKYYYPLKVYKKKWNTTTGLIFGLEFQNKNYYDCLLGVARRNDKITIKNGIEEKFKDEINMLDKKLKTNAWWLDKEWVHKGDFVEYIRTEKNAEQKLVAAFMNFIVVFENDSGLLTKINEDIHNKKVNP